MEYYVKSVVPIIESNYDKFTPVEKQIANFFIHNQKKMDSILTSGGEHDIITFAAYQGA